MTRIQRSTHLTPILSALLALLAPFSGRAMAAPQEPVPQDPPPVEQQEPPKKPKEEKKNPEKEAQKEEKRKADEAAAAATQGEREGEVQEIEQAARESWLSKWTRFRAATRDISEWNVKDGMFRMRFGLRLQVDVTAGTVSKDLKARVGEIEESLDFRRARLFADGDFLRRFHFRFEYDFAADFGLKDAYVDNLFRYKLKYVAFRIGNFKEPFSLSRQTSANYNAFLEWPLPVQTFAPGRSFGIAAYGQHRKGRIAWTLGAFTNSSNADDNRGASDLSLTGRMTGLPRYKDGGRSLVHLGLSLSARKPAGDTVNYSTRPEARFAPVFIGTGDLPASSAHLFALEVAAVEGPFWFQGDLLGARPDVDDMGTRLFGGGYAEVGYFLTGEHRPYRRHDASIGRVEPTRPFKFHGNPFKKGSNGGAFELTGRLSYVDLNDGPVQGGRMVNAAFGMNWYLTRATRLYFNYIRSRVDGEGNANIFLIRYQFNPGYHWPPLDPRWRHHDAEEIHGENE